MHLEGEALRLSIFIGESDRAKNAHRPLYTEIVHRARKFGLAGASVFHGVEGFGKTSVVHTTRLLSMADDLPVLIVIIDSEERIHAFLPELDPLIDEGLVMIDPVHVVKYVARPKGG
jgi:uncharacterized protein